MLPDAETTTAELREAFKRSQLWRRGFSFIQAVNIPLVARSLRMQAIAHRKEHQRYGKPAPIQQALF